MVGQISTCPVERGRALGAPRCAGHVTSATVLRPGPRRDSGHRRCPETSLVGGVFPVPGRSSQSPMQPPCSPRDGSLPSPDHDGWGAGGGTCGNRDKVLSLRTLPGLDRPHPQKNLCRQKGPRASGSSETCSPNRALSEYLRTSVSPRAVLYVRCHDALSKGFRQRPGGTYGQSAGIFDTATPWKVPDRHPTPQNTKVYLVRPFPGLGQRVSPVPRSRSPSFGESSSPRTPRQLSDEGSPTTTGDRVRMTDEVPDPSRRRDNGSRSSLIVGVVGRDWGLGSSFVLPPEQVERTRRPLRGGGPSSGRHVLCVPVPRLGPTPGSSRPYHGRTEGLPPFRRHSPRRSGVGKGRGAGPHDESPLRSTDH